MQRTAQTRQAVVAGRKRGAVLGVFVFLVAAMVPGFSLGSYAALILYAQMTGHAADPGWMGGGLAAAGGMVGVVCAASISILGGWYGGGAFASVAGSLRQVLHDRREEQERSRKGMRILAHGRMAESTQAGIRSRLSFLQSFRDSIHSIAVVGSAAHGSNERGSDVDIVIVCKKDGLDAVLSAVAEREMDDALRGPVDRVLEFTVVSPSQTEKLFELASPFAFALCRGLVLDDDGYLASLADRHPRVPGRKYALTALYQSIMVPYYGSFRSLHRNAKGRSCSSECCRDRRSACEGIASADVPVSVIMGMLYVTLPLRGCMPLTKEDVIAFTRLVYGDESAEAVHIAVDLARNKGTPIYYTEYQQFKRFAGMLYREILGAVGTGRAVSRMLHDGASMVQGRYGQLKDRDLRRCVQLR
jgi:predicted nucleotidyltransferase